MAEIYDKITTLTAKNQRRKRMYLSGEFADWKEYRGGLEVSEEKPYTGWSATTVAA